MALRYELVFEALTVPSPPVQDGTGRMIEDWVEDFRCFGEVEGAGSREVLLGGKVFSETVMRFYIRDDGATIDPARSRIIYNGKTYNIAAPRPTMHPFSTQRRNETSRRPYLAIDGWCRE